MVKLSSKLKTASKSTLSVVMALSLLVVMLPAGIGLLSANATVTPWGGPSDIAEDFGGGDGSDGAPFKIATGAQLALLAKRVNEGETYASKYFKLTEDIDLNNQPWTPIGGGATTVTFQGAFDGDNHTITGLKFDDTATVTSGKSNGIGLFGRFGGSALKNLRVEGEVKSYLTVVAGLIGTAYGSFEMTNCHYYGSVQGAGQNYNGSVGGLIANVGTTGTIRIVNCSVTTGENGGVRGVYPPDGLTMDGDTITGYNNKYACENVGGLVGNVGSGAALTIEDSFFNGTVSGGDGTGGVVGTVNSSSSATDVIIKRSYSTGAVISHRSGSAAVGGLVGWVRDTSAANTTTLSLTISDCYSAVSFDVAIPDKPLYAGGLFGGVRSSTDSDVSDVVVTMTNSHFAGTNAKWPLVKKVTDSKYTSPNNMMLTWGEGTGNLYYLEGSYTDETVAFPGTLTAADCAYTAEKFADGTVTALLNTPAIPDDINLWTNGANGYPVFAVLPELTDLKISAGSLAFDKGIKEYDVTVSNGTGTVTVIPTADAGVSIKVNGVDVSSGTPSDAIALTDGGMTPITIEVTRDGNTIIYTIEVTCSGKWDGSSVATGYAGGDGSENDPYQIATAAQLAYLAREAEGDWTSTQRTYYKLTADIDLGNHNWTPIGLSSTSKFAGYFDGNGKTISNLYCTNTASSANAYLGLFGYVYEAKIHDLKVTDALIEGGSIDSGKTLYVGGVVGSMNLDSTLYNCTFDGTVTTSGSGSGNRYVGGLVGWANNKTIKIIACTATGSLELTKKGRGAGIVGFAYGSTTELTIESSVCAMSIDLPFSDTWSGVAGMLYSTSAAGQTVIKNSIFVGEITGNAIPISSVADIVLGTDVYVVTGWYGGTDGAEASGAGASNLADREKAAAAFTDGTVKGLLAATAADTVAWAEGAQYPVPTHTPATNSGSGSGGTTPTPPPSGSTVEPKPSFDPEPFANYNEMDAGTAEKPYQIANKNQLYFLAVTNDNISAESDIGTKVAVTIGGVDYKVTNYRGKYIVLTADIDWGNEPWAQIGGTSWYSAFAGKFDGQGHKISNINCYDIQDESIGVFGMVNGATIKNLYIENATFKHNQKTLNASGGQLNPKYGGIAGYAQGTNSIINCHVNANFEVTANSNNNVYVGGIVGFATGTLQITGCSTTGSITSVRRQNGGLLGILYGTASTKSSVAITGSYSAMSLTTTDSRIQSGGLVGSASDGVEVAVVTIANSHFAGSINHPFPIIYAAHDDVYIKDDVYFMAGSYTTTTANPTVAGGGIDPANLTARERSADEFKNGTVTNLLNSTVLGTTTWKNGTAYPLNVTTSEADLVPQITVSGGTIKYDPNTFMYDALVTNSTTETVIIPKFVDGATLTVNGVKVAASGKVSQAIAVPTDGTIEVYVKAQKGDVVNAYLLTIGRREAPPVAGMWDGSLEPFETKGLGDDIDTPILIENEAQLAFLAAMVNGETVYYNGNVYNPPEANADERVYFQKYFKLTADLKLNDVSGINNLDDLDAWGFAVPYNNWTPIGQHYDLTPSRYFGGIFDGDNHTIEGMFINVTLTNRSYNTGSGLFGSTNYTTIRNVHIRKSYITGAQRLGAIIGRAQQKTTMQNCTFDGIIKSTATSATSDSNSGGLIADAYYKTYMQSCWSTGRLIGAQNLGGLVGTWSPSSTNELFNSYSAMEIVTAADTPNVGGLIGKVGNNAATFNVRRCFFAGTMVTTSNDSSPIFGLITGVNVAFDMKDVYYREGSRPTPVTNMSCLGGADGAQMKSVAEFADGTVKALLNMAYAYGDFWYYEDDQTLGYPVPDGKILVTDFKSYVDDKEFDDGNWADKFVNKDGGTLIGGGSSSGNGGSSQYPSGTGESPIYLAVLLLFVTSAVAVGFLVRKKRSVN